MANNCVYRMKICGPKDKVKNLCSLMECAEGAEGFIYGRIFSACIYDEYGDDVWHCVELEGECA